MEHVALGELRVGYQRTGSGPTLLLLHGAVSDSRVWRVELDALADDYTVVAWDTPGCGASSDPPEGYRMADFADALARFIDALGLAPAHVLGHSWGSTLALELYRRRAEFVRTLILVGGYAGWAGSLPPEEVDRRLAFARGAVDEVRAGQWQPTSMPGLFSDVMPLDRANELAAIMSEIRPAGTLAMARALAESDLRDMLGRIGVPTLLVYGDADERSPLSVAEELHAAIPTSTLSVLPGLGHECYLEDPDAFKHAVQEFLRLH